jgi:hypothetical protein
MLGEACIEPIQLKINSPAGKLVVDGIITNLREPYTVSISRSLAFDSDRLPPAYLIPEKNATVNIEDHEGNLFPLLEVSPGIYKTNPNEITGQIGSSYKLKITTSNGSNYESSSEIMPSVPAVDSIAYKYFIYEKLVINSQGTPVTDKEYGFLLSVIVQDPGSERNYYRWKSNGIFEFFSITDVSGLHHCWAPIFKLEKSIVIEDDRYVNGNSFMHDITIIPYDRETKFLARVEQISLTQKAFEFWNEISKQQTGTGSIFDPAPAGVKGNLFNVNERDEFVLGYFGASAVYKDSILIDRFKTSGFVSASPRKPPLNGDCRTMEPYATNIKPPGFN